MFWCSTFCSTSWIQLDANSDGVIDEGREKLWDGQEVFVRWKNNRHAVYFDGNVVLQEKEEEEEEEEEVGKDLNCKYVRMLVVFIRMTVYV